MEGSMNGSASIGSVLAAWADLERLPSHVPAEVAIRQPGPGRACIAWTVAHLANQADLWINVESAEAVPHPFASDPRWQIGGDGTAVDWPAIQAASRDVIAAATLYLSGADHAVLDRGIPYIGRNPALAGRTVTLRYRLARHTAHVYFHIGAMAADLVSAGLSVGDYPGPMLEALDQ
jgi:hypothetical protein